MGSLLTQYSGEIIAVLAVLAGIFGVRQWGKAAGRAAEKSERAERIQKQTAEADKVVQDVENKVNAAPDPADSLRKSGWVRDKGAGGK